MSDLRVTDVQAALRHFAKEGGHDLVTDPFKLQLDNKDYQSLHNTLNIRSFDHTSDYAHKYDLTSYIGHGETPVISHVETEGNTKGLWERSVGFLIPQLEHVNGKHSSYWSPHYDDDENGWIKNHPSGFWATGSAADSFNVSDTKRFDGRVYGETHHLPTDKINPVTDTHDMLARHARGDVPYRGRYIKDGNYRNAVPIQGEHFRHFNGEEATNGLTYPTPPRYLLRTPNSIYITHRTGPDADTLDTYTYDPDTEQLTQLDSN